jgi:tetratricopeptide (TPR) repeat protein
VLEASRSEDEGAQASISYVASCGWLALTHAELGEFDRAGSYLDKAERASEQSRHAYSQVIAWTLAGLVWVRLGHLERAIGPLERSLKVCREKHLTVWQPIPSSLLGLALLLLGRVDEGLHWLEDGVALSEALGVNAYLALWTAHLGEGLLAAGLTERALAVTHRALDLALAHKEQGHRAWALRLQGEIISRCDPPKLEKAEACYREAIALGRELGMRPLQARSHLGLGQMYRRTGNQKAKDHLFIAIAWLHQMDMRFWLEQAEAELKELGGLFVVAASNPELYDYLKQKLSSEDKITFLLDRRREERRQRIQAHEPERRRSDGRRQPVSVDSPL